MFETTNEENEKSVSFYTTYRNQRHTSVEKPAFKVSAFVSSLNHTGNNLSMNSSLNTSSFDVSMKRSPFYRGGTTFGGASSYRESSGKRMKLSPVSNRVRTTRTLMKAKPLPNMKRNIVTSQTAKRILNTLGKMSSPVKDSKKVPSSVFSKPALSELVRNQAKFVNNTKESTAPPVNVLNRATKTAKFIETAKNNPSENKTDILKRFEKTSTANQTSNPFSFSMSPKIPTKTQPPLKPKTVQLPSTAPTTFQPTTEPLKTSFKMKREKTSVSHFSINKEPEIVNSMPEITAATASLPITALPKFNFANKIMNKPKASNIFSPSLNVTPIAKPQEKNIVKNAPPIYFATPEVLKPVLLSKSNQGFNFTSPDVIVNNKQDIDTLTSKNFAFSTPVNLAKKDEESDIFSPKITKKEDKTEVTPAKLELKNNFKPAEGTWNCSTCMIDNTENADKCIACSTAKPHSIPTLSTKPSVRSFEVKQFSSFKKQDNNFWYCPTCMIQNEDSDLKCSACCCSKPVKQPSSVTIQPKSTSEIKPLKTFKSKHVETWNCPVCMIDNDQSNFTCVACSGPKPGNSNTNTGTISQTNTGAFKLKFGKSSNQWECPTCMVTNENSVNECVACSMKKPGVHSAAKPSFKLNENSSNVFGKSTDLKGESAGFKFSTDTTNVKPASGFSFGGSGTETGSSGFSFQTDASKTMSSGFSFAPTSTSKAAGGFLFATSSSKANSNGFSFASQSQDIIKSTLKDSSLPESNTHDSTKPATIESQPKAFHSIVDAVKAGSLKVTEQSDTVPSTCNLFASPTKVASSKTKPDAPSNSNFAQSSMSFGLGAPSTASTVVTFGGSAQNETKIQAPSFNFGKPTAAAAATTTASFIFESAPKSEVPNQMPEFGTRLTDNNTNPVPTFNFGGLGGGMPAASLFGAGPTAASLAPPPTSSGLIFGGASTTPASPSVFGSVSTFGGSSNALSASGGSLFGSGFGGPNTAPLSGGLIFGAAPSAQPTASFNFGSSSGGGVPSFEVKPAGFNLSSTNIANQQAPTSDFNFASSTPFSKPAGSAEMSDSKPVSVFGQNPLAPPSNLFSMGQSNNSSQSGGPMKRQIRKAVRRKQKNAF